MQNLLEIQNALRSAPDQQLMALMQGANPTVPQWAVASELNNRKEMRDEQTRQQGLGQPTVLQQLTGTAPAPTPQTNVAGMPQGVASGMAQSMAPKTNVNQNTGINTVARNANAAAPVATMASGGVLKMQDGGDPAEKTYIFIYPEGMNRPSFELEISASGAYNSVVKAIRELGGTIIEKDTGRVMQSDTAKEILQESSDVAEADARVPEYVPSASDLYGTESGRFKSENATPENYVVSAGLSPAGGAMYSSPTGGQGGGTDSSLLGLPADEFSQTPLSAISTPKGLATLAAAGDADMRDETPVVDTTFLTETQRRIGESDAKRARAAFLKSLAPNNAQGQPGGTVGGFRGLDALISRSPNSGELTPTQTARNQEMLEDTLERERIAQQRQDSIEKREIAKDAAETRKVFSVPITIDATKPLMSPEAFSSGVMNDKAADAAIATTALTDTVEPKVTPDIAEFGRYANQYTRMRNEREVDSVVEAAERAEIARVKAKIAKREALNTSEKELADKITAFGKYADQYTTMRNDSEVDMAVKDAERSEAARIAAKTERQNLLKEIKQNASVDQRSGLERLEAENEANLPEDMKQQLRINSYARAGRTAAEIADLLGVSAGKVLDVAAGTLSAGLLETTALGADVMSAYQAGVMGNTDSGMFYANVANKIKQFSDDTFFEDNKLPRLSTALDIPTNAEADAAAAAEQTKAINAKIMAMPESSAVFAEGSPTQYTPAGIAALNREYGPADEDMSKMAGQIQSVYDAEQAVKDKARFSGSPYRQGVGNIIPTKFTVPTHTSSGYAPPTPAPPQATIAADMVTNVEGADTYNEGIATAINGVQREVPSKEVADQTDANSEASLDDKAAIDIDPMTLLPYNNPLAANPQGLQFSPDRLLRIAVERAKERDAAADERRAEKERIAELEKSAEETKLVYGDTPYTEIPDVPLTSETENKDKSKDKSSTTVSSIAAGTGSKGGSAGGYQDRLASILDRMDSNKERDKWLVGVDAGLRLMGSKNPNFLSAVGESGLGALQGYRQQQALNNKQEIGILSKLGDFDMAERTLQARMAIANASNAGRNRLTAGQDLDYLTGELAKLQLMPPGKNATPAEVIQYNADINSIQSQINAIRGKAPPQIVNAPDADASDDVTFLGRINNYISS